jgi:hypothetical protein
MGSGTLTWTTVSGGGSGVPYTGATGAVNLGAYDLTVNEVKVGKGLANIADNTAVGINALNAASTSGGGNSAFGYQALQANTTGGSSNSAFGYKALTANTTGYSNTAIGANSLLNNTTGYNNISVNGALVFNTTGNYNIGIGLGALQGNKFGNTNIAIGREAGYNLNGFNYSSGTGSGNIFIGYQAGISRNIGSNNTAIGHQSLYSYTVDNYNYSNTAAFGIQSGFNNRTNNNTFLGSFADVDYTINSSITNATAVGYQAKVVASNTMQLGNTDVTNVKTSGTLTSGAVTYPKTHGSANQVLTSLGSGTLSWTTVSGGASSIGSISSTSDVKGATISGTTLILTPADAINGGVVTTGTQTIAGAKTFNNDVAVNSSLTANAAIGSSEITADLSITSANARDYNSKILICNPASSPITITFNSSLPTGFNCMVLQKSADANKINFAAGASVTMKNRNGYTATAGNYAIATIVHIGGNIIVTAGDMQ